MKIVSVVHTHTVELGECHKARRMTSLEVKKGLHDEIVVLTITYASETWVRNESQRSKNPAVEMSNL